MRNKHEHSVSLSEETKRNIYFYHHSIEDHIASLAEQAGDKNLVAPITAELVRLLEAKTLWESFRHSELVPEMRTRRNGNRAGGWPGGAPRTLEANLSGNAPGHRTLSKKARKAIGAAQRKRWAKYHAKEDAQRERWKHSSQSRRDRDMKKQDPKSTSRLKGNAVREFWKKLKKNPAAYEAEIAKRMKARDANKAKAAAGAA